jgi:hypothetical protein
MGYTVIDTDPDRVTIIDNVSGLEICGAYRPVGHDYWSLYVTRLITDVTGLATPPHREHFWSDHGKLVARRWMELIAALYCQATQHDRCTYPRVMTHNNIAVTKDVDQHPIQDHLTGMMRYTRRDR